MMSAPSPNTGAAPPATPAGRGTTRRCYQWRPMRLRMRFARIAAARADGPRGARGPRSTGGDRVVDFGGFDRGERKRTWGPRRSTLRGAPPARGGYRSPLPAPFLAHTSDVDPRQHNLRMMLGRAVASATSSAIPRDRFAAARWSSRRKCNARRSRPGFSIGAESASRPLSRRERGQG